MKIKLLAAAIIISVTAAAYAIEGNEALEKFRDHMANIGNLSGNISWTNPDGITYTGKFIYMSPDKIHIELNNPGGKLIVANGKQLWVYDRGTNICAVQDLDDSKSGGIAALTSGYNATVVGHENGYRMLLQNPGRNYPEITITTDDSFTLRNAVLKNRDGKKTTFSLSNINTSPDLVRSKFDFRVPADAQTIRNPLDIR